MGPARPTTARWASPTGPTSSATRRSPAGTTSGELVPQYSRPDGLHRPRARLHGLDAASTSASRPTRPTRADAKVQDAITSVKPHLKAFLNTNVGAGPGQRLDRDGDGLGLRRRPAAAEERQDQVGRCPRRACTPTSRASRAVQDTEKIDVIQAFLNFLRRPEAVRRLREHDGHGVHDAGRDAADQEDDLAEPDPGADRRGARARPSSTTTSAPRARSPLDADVDRSQGGVAIEQARRRLPRLEGAAFRCPARGASRCCCRPPCITVGLLRRAAGADRAVLVRVGQPGQLRRLLRLDDQQLPRLHLDALRAQLLRSVFLSVATTLVCAVIGFTFAYFISRQPPQGPAAAARGRDRPVLDELHRAHLLVGRPAAEPRARSTGSPARSGCTATSTSCTRRTRSAIGIIYSYLPLMILPIYVSLERIDPALFNAAEDLGATPWRQFRRVVLPLADPGRDRRHHHRRRARRSAST